MTTSEEWAERLEGYIPDDGMGRLNRYRITWSVNCAPEVSTEILAPNIKAARREAQTHAVDCFESNSYWKAELIEGEEPKQ